MSVIKIYPYSQKFAKAFEKKKREIAAIAKGVEVHHIGSTA